MTTADHRLHVDGFDESAVLRMECLHGPDDFHNEDIGCVLADWWDNDGTDILGVLKGPPPWDLFTPAWDDDGPAPEQVTS